VREVVTKLRSKSKSHLDGKGTAKYGRRREAMNKHALIKKIIARLTDELAVYFRAANASRAEATHEQNKAEDKYDTPASKPPTSPAASPGRRRKSNPPSLNLKSWPSGSLATAKPLTRRVGGT